MIPMLPLHERAVHIFFLRRLAQERVPGLSKGETYGDLLTAEVVRLYIRPATAQVKTCYAEALVTGQVPPKHLFPWCTSATVVDLDGVSQQAFGSTVYFSSHAWNCRFSALVGLLDQHYSSLSGSKCGARFLPVYYWLDIFAVTQHFEGNFKDHPDADFRGVIRTAKSVLFTMIPWRAPVTPTRVWCLFEALAAIQTPGVGFDVLLDVKDSKDTRVKTITVISNSIDVRTAHATVMSDKTYILGCIEQGVGVGTFNNTIRKRLKEALLQAVTPNAVEMGDTAALHELLKIGGCVRPDGICEFSSMFRLASEGDILRILRSMQIRDLRPRGLVLTGRRQKEVMLSDAGLRDWDDEGLRLREYGEVETGRMLWNYLPAGPALCQSIAELLLMPPASSTNRGVEELWISLRAPRADEFAQPPAVLRQPSSGALISTSAAAAAAASLGIQGGGEEGDEDESSPPSPRAGPSGPSYGAPAPSLPPLRGPASAAASADPDAAVAAAAAAALGGTWGGNKSRNGFSSATAARAAARAAVASPSRRRAMLLSIGCSSGGALLGAAGGGSGGGAGGGGGLVPSGSASFRASGSGAIMRQQQQPSHVIDWSEGRGPAGGGSGGFTGGGSGGGALPTAATMLRGSSSSRMLQRRPSFGGGQGALLAGVAAAGAAGSNNSSPRVSMGGTPQQFQHPLVAMVLNRGSGSVGSSPRMSGTGLPPAPQPGGGLGSYGSPRVSMTGLTGSLGGTAPVQPGLAALIFTERGGGGSAPSSGPASQTGSPRALHPQPPSGHMVGASNPRVRWSTSGISEPASQQPQQQQQQQQLAILRGNSSGIFGARASSPTAQERPELPLPPGRPALWAGVGGSPTLRTLCLYQSVLAPQDVAMLAAALRMNTGLVNLQFVRCSAPGPEGNTAVSTARLTGELLALGLSASNLRQLHVRPADPLYLDSIPPCCPPRDSLLRRVSLTPVALSPAAIRQLGRLLAPLPELESLTVGLDPAPYTTFMPRDPSEWDQWLWFEDRNDPEMASRRRRYMGLDDEGQASYVANAIDLKDELLALPRAGSSHGGDAAPNGSAGGLGGGVALAPMDQRAAGISMCLALLCGWRDLEAYRQQYGRWEWARRVSLEDSLAEMTRNFESMAVIVIESLQATPPAYSARFDAACRHSLSNLKPTRLQEIYWELYA